MTTEELLTKPISELSEQEQKERLKLRLKDRTWRLNNLYYVKDKSGNKVRFKFNRFQEKLYKEIWYFNIVLKARQLGITTFFCILYLDAVLFKSNQTAGIIAHTEKDAKKIFKEKIRFAFDNLPESLRHQLEIKTDSTEELSFRNGSSIFVSVSTRSGTIQYLHISEFGYTCKKFPEKAEEIVTGAINSVEQGQMVSIESTAKGRQGYFFDFCQTAEQAQRAQKKLNKLEFKFFFFSWWKNPEYVLDSHEILPIETQKYFQELEEKEQITLTNEQKQWYYAKYKTLKDEMFSEYPSTSEEAFLVSNETAYYGKYMNKVIADKRVTFVPHEPKILVDTWWDLGMNDFNVVLFTQTVGKEIRFINMYYSRGQGLQHYASHLRKLRDDLGYIYGSHYLPHDVEVRELSTGVTRHETLRSLGVTPIRVVPKLGIQEGIEMTRNLFGRFWFDKEKCQKLVDALLNYRQEWDDKLGQAKNQPLHDDNSHFADAVRALGVCFRDRIDVIDNTMMTDMEKYGLFPSIG